MEYICVFEYIGTLHSFSQIYSNLPTYETKLIFFFSFNFLPKLYSNIICKNIVKSFWKFEVGYSQTCTSLKSKTMWHPKGVTVMCFHLYLFDLVCWTSSYVDYLMCVLMSFIFSLLCSDLFSVPLLVLWVGLKIKWIIELACEKYFCKVTY